MKAIKFLETVSPYQEGDVATFEDDVAGRLVDAKKAVEVKMEKKSVSKKEGDGGEKTDLTSQSQAGGDAGSTQSAQQNPLV